jgi:1-deoxy-D-xylulose-5-phosphate reductoisomerase
VKKISVLGATGSIGRNTLEIARRFQHQLKIVALAAGRNAALLADQISQFEPEIAAVLDADTADRLKALLPRGCKTDILNGSEGYQAVAAAVSSDMLVSAVVGAAGLEPTLAAIAAGKDIALANKETLVMAGRIVMREAAKNKTKVLPVDSEHSAIFQCLEGNRRDELDKIYLTASGGPFLGRDPDTFGRITPEDALRHPNWQMGRKITIDSATLMNKGLEVIEARWLFDVTLDQIEVIIHPQSIVHSMVAYQDGSVMAQLGVPDMKVAIAYALSYPQRLPLRQQLPAFAEAAALTFQAPDDNAFPCLGLAFAACEKGATMPAVLNAANEVAVEAFLAHAIGFDEIATIVETTMQRHETTAEPELEAIIAADAWARQTAQAIANDLEKENRR